MLGRDILEEFASTGKYVFHGAPKRIDRLAPMQAMTLDTSSGKMINDGEPAVAATLFLDIAIFRALVNKTNCPTNYRSSFGLNNGTPFFKATEESLESAKRSGSVGYVHVLEKDRFTPYSPKEVRSYSEIVPIDVIEVMPEDLPRNIEIIKI